MEVQTTLSPQALEKYWAVLMQTMQSRFGKQPDMESVLFLIGVQELGQFQRSFSKEEKQDVMHLAVCHLLSLAGYFTLTHRDDDGWPHFELAKNLPLDVKGLVSEEKFLQEQILKYFSII